MKNTNRDLRGELDNLIPLNPTKQIRGEDNNPILSQMFADEIIRGRVARSSKEILKDVVGVWL
jgi:hypothetical protein